MAVTPKKPGSNRLVMMKPAYAAGIVVGVLMLSIGTYHLEAGKASSGSFTDDSERVADLKLQISRLEESLALANTEADYFHQKWLALQLKVEALGIEALTANEKSLEEKNVRMLGDLFRSEKRRISLEKAVRDYLEADQVCRNARPLEKARARAELEGARRSLVRLTREEGGGIDVADNLNQGQVTLFDEKTQVAIVNFGKAQGAVVGTPFRILKGNDVIGRCRLIEVREYLSAALLEDLVKNKTVQPGDRLLMDTVK